MKMMIKSFVALSGVCLAAGTLLAGGATGPYQDTRIEAKLNVTVNKGTDVVHFIRDNNDPSVYTKVYVLKHADPYELRGYLRNIVQAKKVRENFTGVQAIRYTDGTGMLIVSAEDYRFKDTMNGQGIDSIIAMLDKPKMVASSGAPNYVYYPKYRSAEELMNMVRLVGANVLGDVTENVGGIDLLETDANLNLLFFNTSNFSRKNINNVLKKYDVPYAEVRTKITVYELYAENDTKLGLDFQAWKNNDGIDLFNAGGRFMRNHNAAGTGLLKGTGWNDTQYLQFSPKWNTKYIDFLTSKGKAKVLHTCELTARGGKTARIARTTQAFVTDVKKIENKDTTAGVLTVSGVPGAAFTLEAHTGGGEPIVINAIGAVDLTVTKMQSSTGTLKYILRLTNGNFFVNGRNAGHKAYATKVVVRQGGRELAYDTNTPAFAAEKGNTVETAPSREFGFYLSLTPAICDKTTTVDISITNSSLIGYNSDGSARIQKGATVEGNFMISNEGTRLVIGGIEKRDVVSVSGGIPILKDLPLLGWLFSTESESTKRSQLVVVAEVVPVRLNSKMPACAVKGAKKVEGKLKKAGNWNTYGYRQFLLDPERKFDVSDVMK